MVHRDTGKNPGGLEAKRPWLMWNINRKKRWENNIDTGNVRISYHYVFITNSNARVYRLAIMAINGIGVGIGVQGIGI